MSRCSCSSVLASAVRKLTLLHPCRAIESIMFLIEQAHWYYEARTLLGIARPLMVASAVAVVLLQSPPSLILPL